MTTLELKDRELAVLKGMIEQEAEMYRSCPDPIIAAAENASLLWITSTSFREDVDKAVWSLIEKVRKATWDRG